MQPRLAWVKARRKASVVSLGRKWGGGGDLSSILSLPSSQREPKNTWKTSWVWKGKVSGGGALAPGLCPVREEMALPRGRALAAPKAAMAALPAVVLGTGGTNATNPTPPCVPAEPPAGDGTGLTS